MCVWTWKWRWEKCSATHHMQTKTGEYIRIAHTQVAPFEASAIQIDFYRQGNIEKPCWDRSWLIVSSFTIITRIDAIFLFVSLFPSFAFWQFGITVLRIPLPFNICFLNPNDVDMAAFFCVVFLIVLMSKNSSSCESLSSRQFQLSALTVPPRFDMMFVNYFRVTWFQMLILLAQLLLCSISLCILLHCSNVIDDGYTDIYTVLLSLEFQSVVCNRWLLFTRKHPHINFTQNIHLHTYTHMMNILKLWIPVSFAPKCSVYGMFVNEHEERVNETNDEYL